MRTHSADADEKAGCDFRVGLGYSVELARNVLIDGRRFRVVNKNDAAYQTDLAV